MFKKNKLRFMTEKQKSKRRAVITSVVVAVIAILLVCVSLIVLFKNRKDNSSTKKEPSTNPQKSASKNLPDIAKILVLIPESDRSKIYYIGILEINSKTNRITLVPIDKGSLIPSENMTFEEYYEEKGLVTTASQIASVKNIKIDRYIAVHSGNIGAFCKNTGFLQKDFQKEIDYQGKDFRLQINKGKNKISGNEMLKLLRYYEVSDSSTYMSYQSKVIAEYLTQAFDKENLEKGEDFFNSLVNLTDTNISVVDYTKYRGYLIELNEKKVEVEVK